MEQLLAAGASVHGATGGGESALHAAARAGKARVVEQLLAGGAAVNRATNDGETPLYMAARTGQE
eukprot:COSAG02_NODE_57810_length_279_cov_0.861111_1_plen_64_part_10